MIGKAISHYKIIIIEKLDEGGSGVPPDASGGIRGVS